MTAQNTATPATDPFLAFSQELVSYYSEKYRMLMKTSDESRKRLVSVLKRLREEMGVKSFRPSWNFEAIQTQEDAERAVNHLADILEQELAGTLDTWHIKTHSIVINGKRISRGFYYHQDGTPVFDESGMHKQYNIDQESLPEHIVAQLRAARIAH